MTPNEFDQRFTANMSPERKEQYYKEIAEKDAASSHRTIIYGIWMLVATIFAMFYAFVLVYCFNTPGLLQIGEIGAAIIAIFMAIGYIWATIEAHRREF